MAIPNLIQVVRASSSTATPTSLLTTPSSTTVGTALIMSVSAVGSAAMAFTPSTSWQAINPPAGQTQDINNGGVFLSHRWYIYPANPGAIVSAGITNVTNCVGIGIDFYEFDQLDWSNLNPDTFFSAVGNTNTGLSAVTTPTVFNDLWLGSVSYQTDTGLSLSGNNIQTQAGFTRDADAVSTTGAHTVTDRVYRLAAGTTAYGSYGISVTFGASCIWIVSLLALRTTSSFQRQASTALGIAIGGASSPSNGGMIG